MGGKHPDGLSHVTLGTGGGPELPEGIYYSEVIEFSYLDAEGLGPFNASMCIIEKYRYNEYVLFDDWSPVYISLVDLAVVNGVECYIFGIIIGDEYLRWAVSYSGDVYMFEG